MLRNFWFSIKTNVTLEVEGNVVNSLVLTSFLWELPNVGISLFANSYHHIMAAVIELGRCEFYTFGQVRL